MANTTNFGWETPDDTDLVKDGAAAIRTLGSSIDTSFVDLKGGTTGQILSKASNTDLDFTWTSDATGIQATIFDAKGDLIAASAADTAARLASSGVNGDVLTVDTSTSTGLKWAAVPTAGMVLLSSGSLSGASVTISSISSSYIDLYLVIRNVRSSTDNEKLRLRFNQDTNSNRHIGLDFLSPRVNWAFDSTSGLICDDLDSATSNGCIFVSINDYTNTTTWKTAIADAIVSDYQDPNNVTYRRQGVVYNQTAAVNAITIFPATTNFAAGTYSLYGVK